MIFETAEKTYEPPARISGILLHPTSLPSPYGIGDLGDEAYRFADFLEKSGQHLWQILPLGPTGFGDSPYQSFSAFAGQPLLISPKHLEELGLLTEQDLENCPCTDREKVNYGDVIVWKTEILHKAYANYCHTADKMLLEEYDSFYENNRFWLDDYALFMACKEVHNGQSWLEWEEEYHSPSKLFVKELENSLAKEIRYHQFVQFIFFKEWYSLKEYANKKKIQIIGDIPIFVSLDSADVWANQELFQLDSKGFPIEVAGVPPDYFSETGQLWGNPLYNWSAHKKTGFKWWISRIQNQLGLSDYLRIDHFRGFEAYWSVPYGEETAVNGKWKPGPKEDLFLAIEKALGENLPIIAEDLGVITPEVERLRDRFHFPGMKVLQFAFDSREESDYLPHNYEKNCVVYTGTHDNNTVLGWLDEMSPKDRAFAQKYMNYADKEKKDLPWDFIRLAMASVANLAVIPIQDYLCLGSEARINKPSTLGTNWKWRLRPGELTDEVLEKMYDMTKLYGRLS